MRNVLLSLDPGAEGVLTRQKRCLKRGSNITQIYLKEIHYGLF